MSKSYRPHRPGKSIKVFAVGLTTTALTLSMAACGGGDASSSTGGGSSSSSQDWGTIRMGVADVMPSAGLAAEPQGLIPELAARVLKEMGVKKIETVPMDFGALIPSLQSGRIDIAPDGFYVTAERCKALILSKPPYYYLDGFAVAKGNPKGIKSYADVAKSGAKFGAITGTANAGLAKAAGVNKSKITEYPDFITMLDALKAGRVDVGTFDNVSIAYEVTKPAYSSLSATEPITPVVDGKPTPYSASVGFAKKNKKLADAYNKKQTEMIKAHAFDDIMKKYGQRPSDMQPAEIADVNVCDK